MIDAMFQEGTDKALDDLVQRPGLAKTPAKPGFWAGSLSAPFRGIGAGANEAAAYRAETAGAFGEVSAATGGFSAAGMFALPSEKETKEREATRNKLIAQGPSMSNELGDSLRATAKDMMPDPETTGTAAHVIAGLTRFGTKAVGYMAGGPGGVVDLGVDEGLTEADRLKQQGVDIGTRTQAGAVAGVVAGGSVLIPMTGATALTRFGKGVAAGEGTMIGQALAERAILENAGYDKLASTFDPFDPVSLAVGLVPGVLGAKFGHAVPKPVGELKTEADVRRAAAFTPDEAARSAAFERSAANLAELEGAIKAEKDPGKRLLLVDELETQRKAARDNYVKDSMRADPDLEPAARVRQVADALDESRLTPDSDLRGMAAHQEAIETAHDQIARGEPVKVDVPLADAIPARLEIGEQYPVPIKGGEITLERVATQKPGDVVGAPGWVYNPDEVNQRIIARDSTGKEVGSIDFIPGSRAVMSEVDESMRRRGIGTALYDAAERHGADFSGDPLKLGTVSADALALREARAARNSPARTAAAATELRAARELAQNPPNAVPSAPNTRAGATASRSGADATGRGNGLDDGGPAVGERSPATAGNSQGNAKPGSDSSIAAASRASAEVAALNPDTLVMLDGMESPMRVGDLLAKVKEEAARDAQFAKLVEVAATCALTA